MIKIKNLSKKIKNKVILENINLSVDIYSAVAIFGENGSGKTTLINILSGNDINFSGSFIIDKNVRVGYAPEKINFFPNLTVREFLDYFAVLKHTDKQYFLKDLKIDSYYNYLVKKLSKGYLQRLNIAQAIIDNPQIIFFDEPDNGIDAFTLDDIKNLILNIKKDKIIFISSHNFDFLYDICDFFIILKKGRLIFAGYKNDLLDFLISKIQIISFNRMFEQDMKEKLKHIKYEIFSLDENQVMILFERNEYNVREFRYNVEHIIKRNRYIDDKFLLKILKFCYEKIL